MSTIINGTSSAITFPDSTVQNTAFTTGAVTQSTIATGVAGTGPAFSAYPAGSQTITTTTFTKITLGTEEFDTNNNFASSTFTPTVAGYYQINGKVVFSSINSGSIAFACIYKNGSRYKDGSRGLNNINSSASASICSSVVYLNGTTDYVELYAYQTSGINTDTAGAATFETFLNGALVRAA